MVIGYMSRQESPNLKWIVQLKRRYEGGPYGILVNRQIAVITYSISADKSTHALVRIYLCSGGRTEPLP